ncbi:hypothetical protein OEZ86_003002 [Tetradesmus obliquus]|nr:hypothetical protein OEZ86_003002 [Tetradesmus obliquus]
MRVIYTPSEYLELCSGLLVLFFTATWCAPCHLFEPKLAALEGPYSQELADSFSISTLPTVVLVKAGQEVHRVVGVAHKRPSRPPQRKRAKAGGSAAPARKAPAATGARAAAAAAGTKGSKQTTLHSKGFGALCFSATQQSGSQGATTASQAAAAATAPDASSIPGEPAAATAAAAAAGVQWADKHEPSSVEGLLVHKRKVAELQAWLQVYLEARQAGYCPTRVLLVTGPTGCGKSATLRVLAEALGFELTEWNAPVPTLWQDYQYQAGAAASLGDLAATARCPVVVVATTEEGGSGGSKGAGYSSYGSAAAGMTSKGLHKDMLAVLEAAGATYIHFNPITANTISTALHSIAAKEGFALDPDTADAIAQAAAGDLRNAIQSLQLLLLQQQPAPVQAGKRGKAKAPKRPRRTAKDPEAAAAADAAKRQVAGQVARDQHLSVYHAVGKLLHYKRQQPGEQQGEGAGSQQQPAAAGSSKQEGDSDVELVDAAASQQEQQQANSRFWRPPLRINPEAIIQGSGLEALQVTSFLAENYPHFFAEDAMEQAAAAAAYLSDAGYMACHRSIVASSSAGFWDEDDAAATSLQASAAASTAARGLLYSNSHPAPSRWLPLKGPSCYLPERAAAANLQRLAESVQQLQDGLEQEGPVRQQAGLSLAGQLLHSGRQERAAQVLPYLQVLSRAQQRLWVQALLPRSWCHVWNGSLSEGQGSGRGMQAPPVRAALAAAVGSVLASSGGGVGMGTQQQQQQQQQQHGLGAAGQAGGGGSSDEIDEIEDD